MKAICFQDIQRVSIDRIPEPTIQSSTDAIVAVELSGLCGSDLHPYFGREAGLDPGTVMGHEFVGRVIEVGESVPEFNVGDHVCSPFTTSCGDCFYCRRGLTSRCQYGELFGWRHEGSGLHGGQSERVRVPLAGGTLMRIPDSIDPITALLLGDNLSTGYYGASMAVDPTTVNQDVYVVVGCGTVGLLAIASAIRMGAKELYAVDPSTSRLRIAEQIGAKVFETADGIESALAKATGGRGADGVMEFVGLPAAQNLAYRLLRPGGRMSVIGCHCTPGFAFSPAQAYDKNLTYRTGRCPARHYMDLLPPILNTSPMDLSWCVTHRFGVDDAVEAYDVFANRKDGCVKAVIEFNST